MKPVNINCPLCGAINYDVDLQENDGMMECVCCHAPSRVISLRPLRVIPFNEGKSRPFFWSKIAML